MNEFEGTPGPWEVIIGGNFLQVWEQDRYPNMKYLSRSFGKIAEIALSGTGNNPDGEEDIANARLIAAAPDLLEALNNLCKAFEFLMHDEENADWHEEYVAARAAIKKALGQ